MIWSESIASTFYLKNNPKALDPIGQVERRRIQWEDNH
jgi:hypothetical protein